MKFAHREVTQSLFNLILVTPSKAKESSSSDDSSSEDDEPKKQPPTPKTTKGKLP